MISVCMATYNGENFIKEQIDSILCQISDTDELIISDDGSIDKTLEIINSYNDQRIKIVHHIKNIDLFKKKYSRNFYFTTQNFENALSYAKGDYIFLSDQDDVWMPARVEKMVKALKQYDCVLCNNVIIDSNGKEISTYTGKKMVTKSVLKNLKNTPFLGCCMAFTRKSMNYFFPFPKKLLCHDLWIGCLCAYREHLFYLDEPLHKYRIHDYNVSPTVTEKSTNPLWFKIQYRIVFIYQFILQILKEKF